MWERAVYERDRIWPSQGALSRRGAGAKGARGLAWRRASHGARRAAAATVGGRRGCASGRR